MSNTKKPSDTLEKLHELKKIVTSYQALLKTTMIGVQEDINDDFYLDDEIKKMVDIFFKQTCFIVVDDILHRYHRIVFSTNRNYRGQKAPVINYNYRIKVPAIVVGSHEQKKILSYLQCLYLQLFHELDFESLGFRSLSVSKNTTYLKKGQEYLCLDRTKERKCYNDSIYNIELIFDLTHMMQLDYSKKQLKKI